MDNRHIDITDVKDFSKWLERCVGDQTVCGWSEKINEQGTPKLILFWTESTREGYNPFPYALENKSRVLGKFLKGWLKQCQYPPQPDHDGHNERGFRIYNNEWGHVDGMYQAFLAIEPAWAMYGK